MPARSAAKGNHPAVEAMIESPNKKLAIEPPSVKPEVQRVIDNITDVDIEASYAELKKAMEVDLLSPGAARTELAKSHRHYRQAHRLYMVARIEQEAYDHRSTVVLGSLLDAARKALEKEKAEGKRSRAPTKDEVEVFARTAFTDEFERLDRSSIEHRKMVEDMKHLVDVFKRRHTALEIMNSNRAEKL